MKYGFDFEPDEILIVSKADELEKAKEIIRDLLDLKSTCDTAEEVKRRFEVRERAEAFLKEETNE